MAHVARHEDVHARADAVGVVAQGGKLRTVRALHPPVGHHDALKAPLSAQHRRGQIVVVMAPNAVELVVGGHEAEGLCLADADLEAAEIEFAQGALRDPGVVPVAVGLLVVAGEMLGAGGVALTLYAAHGGGRHFPGQEGILGIILEVAAAERIAVQVNPGGQVDVDAVMGHLLPDFPVQGLDQLRVPGAGEGRADGDERAGFLQPQTGGAVCRDKGTYAPVTHRGEHAAENAGIAGNAEGRIHPPLAAGERLQLRRAQPGEEAVQTDAARADVIERRTRGGHGVRGLRQTGEDPLAQRAAFEDDGLADFKLGALFQ